MALKALGAVLIAVPHIIGAPHPEVSDSAVPAVLAANFAANSLAMMALFWIVLGVSLGWAMNRPQTPAGG
jgi:predicted cobalt transporter CbtA